MKKRRIFAGIMALVLILSTFIIPASAAETVIDNGTFVFSVDRKTGEAGVIRYIMAKAEGNIVPAETVVIPAEYEGHTVTNIATNAFYGTDVKTVIIPGTVTKIGEKAFNYCKLEYIDIPSSVKSIGEGAFYYCTELEKISFSEGLESIGKDAFTMCQSIESIYLPESLKSLGSHAFQGCLALKSVSMGTGIESAEAGVFKNCSSLESAEVTILSDYMFFGCTSLKHLTFNDIGEEICDHAFEACDSLEEVIIPDGVKIIGKSAFDGCSMLSRVEIPEGVTKIDNWAFSKASFTSIDLPESLSDLGFSVFAFCDKLESVVLPERVRSIKANLFYKCSSLKDIVIECDDPDRIGADILEYTAFYNNTENWEDGMLYYGDFLLNMAEGEVTEISVREGTTVIASGAFSDKDLITVSLPDSLEVICANVFDEGSAVKYVKYYGNKAQWANVLVAEDNKELKEANVVCMDEHIHTEKWIVVKEATETEAGFKYCICSACGEILCEKEYSLVYSVRLSGNGTEIRYRVGDIVTLSHPLENKDEATGRTYIFAGWELVGIDDEELDLSNNKISFVMPENDVTAKAKTYIIGDVNRDGKLTALDTLALSVAIKDGKTDHIYDVNCDGRVTAIDKLALSRLLKD